MTEIDINKYMEDGLGRLVPIENVHELDKIKDNLVRGLAEKAKTLQEEMIRFKKLAYSEIAAFMDLAAAEYNKTYGGQKGNLKFASYDHKLTIQVQIHEDLTCDERLQIAKELIDKCLDRWTIDGKEEIRTIVNEDFAVNQKGRLNIHRILGLRRYRFDDPEWQEAMDIISDSLQVSGSKSYFRVYERGGQENSLQCITLDFSKL